MEPYSHPEISEDALHNANKGRIIGCRPGVIWGMMTASMYQKRIVCVSVQYGVDVFVQVRRTSMVNALELRVSCTNPSICVYINEIRRV